jgi:nucleoside-diphosphate-sugar epimerase
MNFVLGARGQLGKALVAASELAPIVALERGDYAEWWRDDAADAVTRFFRSRFEDGAVVYVAAGILHPGAEAEDHERANFRLPRNVVLGAARAGLRTVTFGTAMETVMGDQSSSPYVASKLRLGNFVQNLPPKAGALHVRLHTLYGGGPPHPFMFLGQIWAALATGSEFRMSPGKQLREYHHVEDDVAALRLVVESGARGALDLSHGSPIALCDLARHVFEQFQRLELLQLGALSAPATDNYSRVFARPAVLSDVHFRDALSGVVDYLRACPAAVEECR